MIETFRERHLRDLGSGRGTRPWCADPFAGRIRREAELANRLRNWLRDPRYFVTTDNVKYAASTALTITLNSLAASTTVGRQATVVDNSSNLYDDVLVTVIISTSASAIGSSKSVYVYVAGSEDGSNYDDDDAAIGATDAAYTINSPTNLKLGMVMSCPTSSKVYSKVFSIASLYGGVVPRKWTIVVCNDTNQALLGSGNSASYSGITYTNQ